MLETCFGWLEGRRQDGRCQLQCTLMGRRGRLQGIMTRLEVEVSDRLAEELQQLVSSGWFENIGEIARLALVEFIKHHRFELQEKLQREDIAWALEQSRASSFGRAEPST